MNTASEHPGLADKVVLVTGAARNVGRGVAEAFARAGARVWLNDLDGERLSETVSGLARAGLKVRTAAADLADADAIERLMETIVAEDGAPDVLINNAILRGDGGERGPFLEVRASSAVAFMQRNLEALFRVTQSAAKHMAARRRGVILNVSSNGAVRAHRNLIAYDTVKGGLEAFTRAIAIDLAPWGVRVNTLRPIAVHDPAPDGTPAWERERGLAAQVPLGRIARPGDVAQAALFLASDAASFITGQALTLDGGMLSQSRPPQLEEFTLKKS